MADTPPPAADADLDATRARLEATEKQLNDYKLQLADHVNARKRLVQSVEAEKKYANEPLARDLLGALDNLDRAMEAAKEAGETGPLVAGVAATSSQILDVFRRYGITRIECPPGTVFDPHLHQAVMMQPSNDQEPGEVMRVLQQGFLIHDRVLRPASVIVSTIPPAGGSNE
jgi:molecular chaperone GrpE